MDRYFWRSLDLPESDRLFRVQILSENGYSSLLGHPAHLRLRELGAEAEGVLPRGLRAGPVKR